MNDSPQDRQLRTFFRQLGEDDAQSLPHFADVLAGAEEGRATASRRRTRPGPLVWGFAVLSVAVAAAFVATQPGTDSADEVAAEFEELHQLVDRLDPPAPAPPRLWTWQSPTEFLLVPVPVLASPNPKPEDIQ